jgi:hypothetical protein
MKPCTSTTRRARPSLAPGLLRESEHSRKKAAPQHHLERWVIMVVQLIPAHSENPESPRRVDRRAWVRFPKSKEVGCHSASTPDKETLDTAWLGSVRDMSLSGLGLSLRQRFEAGTALIVETSERLVLRHLLVHVVHVTAEWNRRWLMGKGGMTPSSRWKKAGDSVGRSALRFVGAVCGASVSLYYA